MRKSRILIVEDEGVLALEMKEFLEQQGYEVGSPVDSANRVIDEVLSKNIDLIIMDIHLKSFIDGIDAAQRISIIKPIPVVFLTAYPDSTIKERAMKTRPAAYLEKPVKMEELLKVIKDTLERAGAV
ncbi:MAG: response regulator [Spirochaetales bacterium]|nr:response regulator [Spirochaetales bacterium]